MLDELKSAEVVAKVGGRFKLASLVQKRMAELLQGSRPLIEDTTGLTLLEIVAQEILQEKITIEMNTESGKSDSEHWKLRL
jgi:DNA-directed RNA polymerase subunit omega